MMKIGFVDRYLDNWHTNHYPGFIREAAATYGFDARVANAWAETDCKGGLTTDDWCAGQGVERCASYEELIERSDAVMVMCADDCLPHEQLAWKALAGGKPLYCDKTFAPDLAAATRMFDRAEAHGTPLFTCSAQRYCPELIAYAGPAAFCATTGPGDIVNYSVHQFEMIERAMGPGASRCLAAESAGVRHLLYAYRDGRAATFTQSPKSAFRLLVSDGEGCSPELAVGDYYMPFMQALLQFFNDRIPPVFRQDTMEIIAMQQAARASLADAGRWADVPEYS